MLLLANQTMIADIAQLHDIRQRKKKSVKSYFKRFNGVINKIMNVTDEKALDALVRTHFWRDVQNSQPKTYAQMVDLIQQEIQFEKMIKIREKVEKEKKDRYHRKGRCFLKHRINRF
ncbi:hypothetical protein Adt_20971 [Abeliophyllum distichum]|uniref:Retrotransposon gag domain-containing protein n=1 Tax=Abeliophyllum distichum TaxID=126358 RepID=A0ABD1SY06_9LAMI